MIEVTLKGDLKNTYKFLNAVSKGKYLNDILNKYGRIGVNALASATPKDTGETSNSWYYTISKKGNDYTITWNNSSKTSNGIPIVVLLQYGHATNNGGYVSGIDFINPAIRPVFDKIAESAWKEVVDS